MADNDILVSRKPVATDAVNTVNGVAAPDTPRVQRIKAGHGAEGEYFDPTPDTPTPTADYTGPDKPQNVAGYDVGTAGVTIGARVQRTRIVIQHLGDQSGPFSLAQRVHFAWNATAVQGSCPALDPGGVFDAFVEATATFNLKLDSSSAAGATQRVCVIEVTV